MPFGDTETLTPEEAASLGTPKSAPSTPKVVGSESLPKVVGEPVDVFSDVEAFKVWKASQPAQDKWETVKAVSKEMGTQIWEFAKEIPSLAGQTARGLINPAKLPEALKANAAFVAETGAEAFKGFATMGKFMTSAGQKGLAASAEFFGADKEAQKFHEEEALKAEMDFYRTARDFTSTVNDGRVILDNVKNTVVGAVNAEWAGENTFTDTEVNEKAALFAANLVDPDVGAVLTKAAMRGYAGKIVGKLVNLAPPEGMIRAAERDVIAAIAAKSDAQEALLAAKAAGADTGKLTADLSKAEQDLIEANQYLRTRLAELDQQAAVGKGTAQRVAGKGIELAGRGVEKFGQVVGGINRRIGEIVDNFGSGGGEAAVRGAIDTVPGVGWINRLDNAFESAGSQIKVAGQYISAAESSLGYFQSLARALPEDTVGRWAASRMERFENLATTGRWIMDSVDTTAKTAAIGAGFGALSGDPTAGATQGFWFGMAGSQFGQFARMNSPEEVRARQQVDVAIARQRRANAPGEQAKLFDEAGAGLQLATATFEQAYPDLNIKFVRGGGKRSAGWYENRGLFGEITIDLDHPTPVAGLLTHEVKHHLGRNPEIKQAVEAKILGDPNTGEIGIFTALDEQGRPILEETPSAENPEVTQKRFKLRPEFDKYRDEYLQRLRDANEPTIEYERDPRMIAHEIWAESEAANLLGRQVNGKFDILAQGQMGGLQRLVADTVAGSDLVKSTAFLQKALAKFGVVFDGEGKAANTGLFSTSFELKGLNKAVEKYNRLRSDERAINEDPDYRDARNYTEAEILASPQLMEMYSGGHDVVRDPVTGKMRFIPEGEAKRRAKDFTETLQKELAAYTGNEPGVVREQTVVDANGRESKVWRGTHIPETVIKKLEESGRFNEVQLKTIRDLNQVMRLGAGNEANFMYQPASKRGGKQYRTRPITERTETPMAFQISKDGNLLVTTISQEKLIRNAVEAIKAGKATLWGNDFQALWADVGTYLRNHQNGEGGAANGLGVEKRNFINSLFGQFTKGQREANPLIQEVSDRRARDAGIVQSRRLDRTNKLTVLSTKFKPDYASVAKNYSPAKKGVKQLEFFDKVPGTPEPKVVTTDDPWAEMRKWNRQEGTKFSRADAEGVKITTEIRAGGEEMLVAARSNGRLVGYVQINPNYRPRSWGWLDIEVAKPWQRLGIGERLYNAAMDAASEAKKRFAMSSKSPDGKKFFPVVEERRRNPEPKADAPGAKVTETPEFKKWSGDKPIFRASEIDTENPPRSGVFEVYHGTKEDVAEFKAKYPDGLIFTTTNPEFAAQWGKDRNNDGRTPRNYPKEAQDADKAAAKALEPTEYISGDPVSEKAWQDYFDSPQHTGPRRDKFLSDTNVMKLYANVEKAFDPRKDYKIVEPLLRTLPGYDGILQKGSHKQGNWIVYENKAVVDLLRSKGYDAMWLSESLLDNKHETLAVFSPRQLKSATGNRGTFDPSNPDIRYSPGAHVDNIRSIDSVGNKTATQVDPASIKYAENPVKDSVVLPPRWGFVNREIVGMERSFADVDAVVTRAVERLTATAKDTPSFAKESARFYEDMADAALLLADVVSPGVGGLDRARLAELMLRYLALGSPRTDVSGNATKSSGSAASVAGGFQPGYKLGFGSQQMGAKETYAAWQKGEHFNLDMPGIDDKVRSFYINGLSELIEKFQKTGDTEIVDTLRLLAAKSLHIVAPDHTTLTTTEAKEVQRHLDGKATVDMWDMAGKGYAWPGFILRKGQRNNAKQPFQWSQDKFAKKATMSDPAWATVLKDLGYTEPKDLRYQEARALRIEGNMDWSEKTWAERVKQPFAPDTQFTYFTQGTEAGLSPGGAGPMYDAQQGMDGLIADRLNELGMAPMFGKEKLKARNAQEILWAQEKLDNPIESNNDLSLYGNTFKQLAATVGELRLGQGLTKRARAEAVLGAMDRAYAAMAKQEMPFEVITSGTSPEAQRIQSKIEALRTAGDPDPVKSLTASVADGLGDTINDLSIKHGLDAFVDEINVRRGGYTEGGKAAISPNIVAILRGKPEDVRVVLDTVSRALDQDGGNIMRKPTVRELNDVNVKKANVLTFDTRHLGEPQREAFFLELAALKDAGGESFLTGFTETSDGVAIGDQFYGGDFLAAVAANEAALVATMARYQVPGMKRDRLVIDTFRRGTPPTAASNSPFAADLTSHLLRKVTEAKAPERTFPQVTDTAALLTKNAAAKAADVGALSKTAQVAVLSQLKSDVDAALLRGQIDEATAERIKAAIP